MPSLAGKARRDRDGFDRSTSGRSHVLSSSPVWLVAALASLAGVAAVPAWASSPQAWENYGQQVQRACVAASRLRQPRPAGDRVDFPAASAALTSALLLQGTYPQSHMAGRRGLELCLYDSATKQARVVDADRLQRPAP